MNDKKRSIFLLAAAAALVLILVLVVCLVSCQQKESRPQVGLCFRSGEENSDYCKLLEKTLLDAGYQVSVADALNDQTRQTEQIRGFLEEEYDLLVIEPVMVSGTDQTVDLLMEADVPAVFIHYQPDSGTLEKWEKLSYVGIRQEQPGTLQGEMILQLADHGDINGDGVVSYLIISGPEDDKQAQLQAAGCISALTEAELTVSAIDVCRGPWTQDSGRALCAKVLAQYGKDVEVIFCGNDTIAAGAWEAIQSGGWQVGEDYYLVGIGGAEQAAQMVRSGTLTCTVSENLNGQAQQVLTVIRSMLAGEAVENVYYVNCDTVTEENVEVFLPQ